MPNNTSTKIKWYRVLNNDELPEGRVKTVVAGHKSLAVSHFHGKYAALDNKIGRAHV